MGHVESNTGSARKCHRTGNQIGEVAADASNPLRALFLGMYSPERNTPRPGYQSIIQARHRLGRSVLDMLSSHEQHRHARATRAHSFAIYCEGWSQFTIVSHAHTMQQLQLFDTSITDHLQRGSPLYRINSSN